MKKINTIFFVLLALFAQASEKTLQQLSSVNVQWQKQRCASCEMWYYKYV